MARERAREQDRAFSLRKVAQRVGVEPAYLSKIERGDVPPPSEATIRRLEEELHEEPDALLAMPGKVSRDLQEIIMRRPQLFAEVLRELKNAPDHAILSVVREVRDGEWCEDSRNQAGIQSMIELQDDELVFRFPAVHEDAELRVEFSAHAAHPRR